MNNLSWKDLSIKYCKPSQSKLIREASSDTLKRKNECRREIEKKLEQIELEREMGL